MFLRERLHRDYQGKTGEKRNQTRLAEKRDAPPEGQNNSACLTLKEITTGLHTIRLKKVALVCFFSIHEKMEAELSLRSKNQNEQYGNIREPGV